MNIQFKRGLSTHLDSVQAQDGEPLFTTDTFKLYVGSGGNKQLINPTIDKTYISNLGFISNSDNIDGGTF